MKIAVKNIVYILCFKIPLTISSCLVNILHNSRNTWIKNTFCNRICLDLSKVKASFPPSDVLTTTSEGNMVTRSDQIQYSIFFTKQWMLHMAVETVAYGGRRRDSGSISRSTSSLPWSHERPCWPCTTTVLYDSSFCDPSGLSARPQQLPIELLWHGNRCRTREQNSEPRRLTDTFVDFVFPLNKPFDCVNQLIH